jgi:RimJ/RimL family protein N-acetyltransferase
MRFVRYGIELERLEARHLEMVRQWRNHESVRLRMRYQEEITTTAQVEWFGRLDPRNDWYFVAERKEEKFGLFHVKQIDWTRKVGEAGGFVSNPELIGGIEAGLGILALMDFAFFILGLQSLEASYHPDYREIVRLNSQLGYEIFATGRDNYVRARVTPAGYLTAAEKLRQVAAQTQGEEVRLSGADSWLVQHLKSVDQESSSDLRNLEVETI